MNVFCDRGSDDGGNGNEPEARSNQHVRPENAFRAETAKLTSMVLYHGTPRVESGGCTIIAGSHRSSIEGGCLTRELATTSSVREACQLESDPLD